MGRHRHVVNVRLDGIAVVLGPLLRDSRVTAAALVDVDSGMVLDAWSAENADDAADAPDLELLGAQHAEVVRGALALLRAWPRAAAAQHDECEIVLGADGGPAHLLRTVPDPHGDRLALAVVVDGSARVLERVRRRLRSISVDALTAGPSMSRRPVLGGWAFGVPGPDVPARPDPPAGSVAPDPGVRPDPVPPGPSRPVHPGAAAVPALSRLDGERMARPVPPHPRPAPQAPGGPWLRAVARDAARAPRPPSPPAALPAPAPRQG